MKNTVWSRPEPNKEKLQDLKATLFDRPGVDRIRQIACFVVFNPKSPLMVPKTLYFVKDDLDRIIPLLLKRIRPRIFVLSSWKGLEIFSTNFYWKGT